MYISESHNNPVLICIPFSSFRSKMNLFICVSIAVFLAYPAFSINSGVPWQNQKSAREINEAINSMPHNESKKKNVLLIQEVL